MLCWLFALVAPVHYVTTFNVWRTFLADVSSFVRVNQTFFTNVAQHVRLRNQIITVLRRPLIQSHLGFLKPVSMLGVLPVALLTEREVVASRTVVPEGAPVDGLVALITAKPGIVSLLSLPLLNLLLDTLAQSVLELLLFLILLSLYKLLIIS